MPRVSLRLTRKANADLLRLARFLENRDAMAAVSKAFAAIEKALNGIADNPHGSRPADGFDNPDIRHCHAKFGKHGYAVLYRIYPGAEVVVLSIKAGLEADFGEIEEG